MFAKACGKAYKFTRPLIISTRTIDGNVSATCGTFFVVNDEGWCLTAGHMFDSFMKFQSDVAKIKELDSLRASGKVTESKDPTLITNHSFWFGWDGVRMEKVYINRQIDIAIVKLADFKSDAISEYPAFRDPETLHPGTSVCRLGFPFAPVATDFDEATRSFRIRQGVLPLPFFPNDGIHTRNISRGMSKDDKVEMLYIETSTPGLRGQSGGPIFDTAGRVYAMQVQTNHIPLGFHPTAEYGGQSVVENQFMNVGVAVHGKVLQQLMRRHGVKFNVETQGGDGETYVIN